MVLHLASANLGKLREFQQAARPLEIEVRALPGFSEIAPCVEDAATFEENARKKALYYSRFTPELVLADDSGLSVDALGGAPGVLSARFAGPDSTDEANNRKLLEELRRVAGGPVMAGSEPPQSSRDAHYICVIVLARQGRILTTVKGRVDGRIIDNPRGSNGFGYAPHFYYPPFGKTFAEVTADEKFAVSHRGEAFRKLLEFLRER
ncbi:MAG: non-canonical purine NTP pyrophosphatase [Acidobacteriia bacterium]|nr:non-canonical purine NTP pyrophosphatase [Terriglobia bacterium]